MNQLTLSNKDILAYLEKPRPQYRKTTSSPAEVGHALLSIRDGLLHREVSSNFYDYCLIQFGMLPDGVDWYLSQADKSAPASTKKATPKRKRASVVYFVRAGGLIKIGVSNDIAHRLTALKAMSPVPIALLASIPGDAKDERRLHEQFAHLRQHGEWFTAANELIDYIGKVSQ